jgi:cell division protein FtsB
VKFVVLLILLLATAAFLAQLYPLVRQATDLSASLQATSARLAPLRKENKELLTDLDYLQKNERLQREVRKAGYVVPGEKMFIIVPQKR